MCGCRCLAKMKVNRLNLEIEMKMSFEMYKIPPRTKKIIDIVAMCLYIDLGSDYPWVMFYFSKILRIPAITIECKEVGIAVALTEGP